MECYDCGFWESDYETCTCPSQEKFYACPIESDKPKNQEKLQEMIDFYKKKGSD